jgi:hypothetical protein
MKKFQAALLALLAALALGTALAGMPDKEPLASVNGQTITAGDLKHYMALQPDQLRPPAGSPITQQELAATLARRALDALVERQLLLAPARQDFGESESAKTSLDAYAERQVRQLEDRAGSRMRARQILSEQGLTVEQYKQFQIDSALIGRFLWSKILSRVTVRPTELREYYEAHRDEFREPRTLVYRQILFTVADPQQAAARRAQAERVLQQLKDGADFAQMAERYSADSASYPGGLHQVGLPAGQADWRPAILQGLGVGQISNVRQVDQSLSIARFEGIVEPHVISFADAQNAISQELLARKRTDAQTAYVADLKNKARIQYLAGAEEMGLHAAGEGP